MDGLLIVMSGFSGAGKGTLMKRLLADYDDFAFSVSMTTRAPREGEVNGREYFFVTREEFEKTIAEDGLVEYAQYVGNYYGTPKAYVNEQLKNDRISHCKKRRCHYEKSPRELKKSEILCNSFPRHDIGRTHCKDTRKCYHQIYECKYGIILSGKEKPRNDKREQHDPDTRECRRSKIGKSH